MSDTRVCVCWGGGGGVITDARVSTRAAGRATLEVRTRQGTRGEDEAAAEIQAVLRSAQSFTVEHIFSSREGALVFLSLWKKEESGKNQFLSSNGQVLVFFRRTWCWSLGLFGEKHGSPNQLLRQPRTGILYKFGSITILSQDSCVLETRVGIFPDRGDRGRLVASTYT